MSLTNRDPLNTGPNNGGLQGPTKQYYLSADKQQTELGKAKYSKYTPKFPTSHCHKIAHRKLMLVDAKVR